MSMYGPYSTSMQRGYSDSRKQSPPPSQANHPGNQTWHHDSARQDSPMLQRNTDLTSYAKRRKTTSALHRPQLPQHPASYQRPSPYSYPSPSPTMANTPLSAISTDPDSWQWSFFPDQRCEDRGSASRLSGKNSPDLSATARTTKPSSRHQRKRSAGCLNCHTVWSPTWRKDAQGLMRCNACGLYLAARGQERPVTLLPKRKSNDDVVNHPKQPSPPREDARYYPARDEYPSSPYYSQTPTMRPSPLLPPQSYGTSSGASSCHSVPAGESRDLLSPIYTNGYSSSPSASPLSFATLSLEPSRRLPYPSESNSLGLKNISRESSADYSLRTPDSATEPSVRINTLPSPTGPYFDMAASRSPSFASVKVMPRSDMPRSEGGESPRLMLPPLSELTRGLSSLQSDFRSQRHYSLTQDRKATQLLDVGLLSF